MLNENIRELRKAKGLSQEELAVRLNVVRQTVSKWEQGLSVPDADMLVALGSPYLGWDYGDSETAVFGAAFHAFEWLFVRAAPLMLTAFAVGAVLTRRRT